MSKTFAVMKTNCANMVQDTSAAMKLLIGVWINDGYQAASRKHTWNELIDDDYTFESVVSQQEYTLETDFMEEIFVANIASARKLKRFTPKDWWDVNYSSYEADAIQDGTPVGYTILYEAGKLKFDVPADTAETFAMPYKKVVADLSADADLTDIKDIEIYLESYAISQAFAYKKQFQKSDYFANKSEYDFMNLLAQRNDRNNQESQFVGADYNTQLDWDRTIGSSNYGL